MAETREGADLLVVGSGVTEPVSLCHFWKNRETTGNLALFARHSSYLTTYLIILFSRLVGNSLC